MEEEQKIKQLAETLKNSGLAASFDDAYKRAEAILRTKRTPSPQPLTGEPEPQQEAAPPVEAPLSQGKPLEEDKSLLELIEEDAEDVYSKEERNEEGQDEVMVADGDVSAVRPDQPVEPQVVAEPELESELERQSPSDLPEPEDPEAVSNDSGDAPLTSVSSDEDVEMSPLPDRPDFQAEVEDDEDRVFDADATDEVAADEGTTIPASEPVDMEETEHSFESPSAPNEMTEEEGISSEIVGEEPEEFQAAENQVPSDVSNQGLEPVADVLLNDDDSVEVDVGAVEKPGETQFEEPSFEGYPSSDAQTPEPFESEADLESESVSDHTDPISASTDEEEEHVLTSREEPAENTEDEIESVPEPESSMMSEPTAAISAPIQQESGPADETDDVPAPSIDSAPESIVDEGPETDVDDALLPDGADDPSAPVDGLPGSPVEGTSTIIAGEGPHVDRQQATETDDPDTPPVLIEPESSSEPVHQETEDDDFIVRTEEELAEDSAETGDDERVDPGPVEPDGITDTVSSDERRTDAGSSADDVPAGDPSDPGDEPGLDEISDSEIDGEHDEDDDSLDESPRDDTDGASDDDNSTETAAEPDSQDADIQETTESQPLEESDSTSSTTSESSEHPDPDGVPESEEKMERTDSDDGF
ncbi:MAG: hypothetical protein ABIC95_05550 [archaeon]